MEIKIILLTKMIEIWKILPLEDLKVLQGRDFVTNRNSVGFARKKAQTISFVERGFERLGLGHQAVGFS